MSENDTQPGGGSDAVVEIQQPAAQADTNPPRSDAEAAQREAEQAAAKPPAEPPKQEGGKKNRTGEYIKRLQEENRSFREREAEYQRRLEAIEKRFPQQDENAQPTREQFDFDESKYEAAMNDWRARQVQQRLAEEQKTTEAQRQQQERFDAYRGRIEKFAADHPDFEEVVSGIAVPLPPQLQLAIMGHESGPEIAYYLGQNEDEAFNLAMVRDGLEAHALDRLVARMKAAQQPPAADTSAPPAQPNPAEALAGAPTPSPTPKTTQAPPPVPTVGGRAPVEVPPEKMTDEEWYKRDRERRRKR